MSELIVREVGADNGREVENRSEAEEVKANMEGLGLDVEIATKDENGETKADGGPEVVETEEVEATETDLDEQLPEEPSVSEDPLTWMPEEFVVQIDGTQAISRKGYAVLAHHYDIEVQSEVMVAPHDTEFEYAQCVATATTPDGKQYTAHGTAHVDRGDDSHLVLEMADTRSHKRALALATGVGTVAVSELQNEL